MVAQSQPEPGSESEPVSGPGPGPGPAVETEPGLAPVYFAIEQLHLAFVLFVMMFVASL